MTTDALRLDRKAARMDNDSVNEQAVIALFDEWYSHQNEYIQFTVCEHMAALMQNINNFGIVSAKVLLSEIYCKTRLFDMGYHYSKERNQWVKNGLAQTQAEETR